MVEFKKGPTLLWSMLDQLWHFFVNSGSTKNYFMDPLPSKATIEPKFFKIGKNVNILELKKEIKKFTERN